MRDLHGNCERMPGLYATLCLRADRFHDYCNQISSLSQSVTFTGGEKTNADANRIKIGFERIFLV